MRIKISVLAGLVLAAAAGAALARQTAAKPKAPAPAGSTPAPSPRSGDPRKEALTSWLEGFFQWGEGSMAVEEVNPVAIPGGRLFRAQKTYASDARANDQCYAVLEDGGKTAIVGDVFIDEARLKVPTSVKGDADLDGVRKQIEKFLRGRFRVGFEPATDRKGWKGIRIRPETGYGAYEIGGYLKADDGAFTILGRVWDRHRSFAEQRRELIDLKDAPFQGPADAKVTVVEFSDMQCAYCKKRTADWEALGERLAPLLKLKRYIKFFPLTNEHPWAFRAASAGLCFFGKDPALFFRWKSNVYSRQDEMNVAALDSFALDFAIASDAGEAAFKACYLQQRANERILADLSEGFAIRVRSTPTYIIDGVPVSWFTDNLMEEYLRKTYLKGAGLPLPTATARPTPVERPATK